VFALVLGTSGAGVHHPLRDRNPLFFRSAMDAVGVEDFVSAIGKTLLQETRVNVLVRLRILAGVALACALALALVIEDAARRRFAAEPARASRRALAGALGLADLALSSGARWIRHPSQVEFAAPLADAPGALDVDPAGSLVAPPRAVLGAGARWRLERRTR
jgi:hypothetical protein